MVQNIITTEIMFDLCNAYLKCPGTAKSRESQLSFSKCLALKLSWWIDLGELENRDSELVVELQDPVRTSGV